MNKNDICVNNNKNARNNTNFKSRILRRNATSILHITHLDIIRAKAIDNPEHEVNEFINSEPD